MRYSSGWVLSLTVVAAVGVHTGAQSTRPPAVAGAPIALVGGTLIDGTGGPPVRNSVVLIRGERIERIGTAATVPVPAGYERVSTEGMSVLPGLWDPHVHLIYAGHPNLGEWLKKYAAQFERDVMPATAEQMLMAGVTSVRDLGAPLEILNVKKRIDSGEIPGPTIYSAGPFLTNVGFGPHSLAVADEASARAATKRLIATGVHVIKFVNADRLASGVARAIVDEARAAGLRTTAHGRSDAEIVAAIAAGVDELQHIGTQGSEYPPDVVAAIRQRLQRGEKLFWSPTVGPDLNASEIAADPEFLDDARNFRGLPASMASDVREALLKLTPRPPSLETEKAVRRKVAQLRELGVELVFGSDEGTFGQTAAQATWRELDAWVRGLGVDPLAAIRAATLDSARFLGADRDVGSVTAGKFADVIAVPGNPLRHIDVLRDPSIVIKRGRRYR